MKIICSTVVRAAKQGDIHGGLYIIDVDSEKVEKYIPYSDSFINDNERGGERGLRGICVLKDRIIVADSAGLFQLDRKNYEIINRVKDSVTFEKFKELADFIRKHRDDLNSKMIFKCNFMYCKKYI